MELENRIIGEQSVPYDLEIVGMGSVFGRFAYDFSACGKKGFLFAQAPQSLSYDYRILQQYKSHLQKGCIIIITLPVCVFPFVDYKGASYNAKYYWFLDKDHMINYSHFFKFIYTKVPVLAAGYRILHILKDEPRMHWCEIKNRELTSAQVEESVTYHLAQWKQQFGFKDMVSAEIRENLKESIDTTVGILHDMLDFCVSNDWQPVLVTPPFSSQLNANISEPFAHAYLYDNIRRATENKTLYLDFRKHPKFQEHTEWFINGASWLSGEGRRYFMELLIRQLKETEFWDCHYPNN
jgi:hypothetical protein